MKAFFILLLILIVVFALALSAYLTFYKFNIRSNVLKGVTFIILAAINTFATLVITVIAIWPGY